MKQKLNQETAFLSRPVLGLLIGATICFIAVAELFAFFRPEIGPKLSHEPLAFAERVTYQRAIEEVYWRHRIWPQERRDAKPSLEAVTSTAEIETKVRGYLQDSQLAEDHWQQPISSQQLQAEMERMTQHTRNPEMLRELFQALGNDPFVIAECLARPALSQRLVNELREVKRSDGAGFEPPRQPLPQIAARTSTTGPAFSGYSLPALNTAASTCDDEWSTLADLPARRADHTGVWTGSEMIVWGGLNYNNPLGTGDSYNPATDTWKRISLINAPSPRANHTAVWTGTDMVIWGGYYGDPSSGVLLNTGGRYSPVSDAWKATSTTNAPSARLYHTAVWTGSEMLVWGGQDSTSEPNTGGRYDPNTDSWKTMTTTNAPAGRYQHSVVWTGTEMIVWGGRSSSGYFNSGARYNPSTDKWTSTSGTNAPGVRFGQSGIWTGSVMIVWGGWNGTYLSDGAKYNPSADTWTAINTTNTPPARYSHSAVWTGSQMVVWGGDGSGGQLNSGGRYNPSTNAWTTVSLTNAPSPRDTNTTIWTGSQMIVFGGGYEETLATGGKYDPAADTWTPVRTTNTPDGRSGHTAVWTGSEMIVWGGVLSSTFETNTGGRYDPALDTWTPTTLAAAPQLRENHTAVWTGTQMIVWGGWYYDGSTIHILNTGGRYDPTADSWTATTLTNAPAARRFHTAVWTGSEMIVWGGSALGPNGLADANSGGRYNPGTDQWVATSLTNAPIAREDHTAVWTGSEMIVWGGSAPSASNTGGRYNPTSDSWTATNTAGAPPRTGHSVVWTGKEMIIWGGFYNNVHVNTGARYNPSTDAWTATSLTNAPTGRITQAAVWTGEEMIIWGGYSYPGDNFYNTGGRYNPETDSWTATSTVNAPPPAEYPTGVWTGSRMIVWGGAYAYTDSGGHFRTDFLSTGGSYCAESSPAPSITIGQSGSQVTISYTGIIQQSSDLSQWGDITPQPSSPWTFTPTGSPSFFKARPATP